MALNARKKLTIDLSNDDLSSIISAKCGEKNSRIIEITLTNDGEPYLVPTGTTARFAAKKPDETVVLRDEDVVIEGGKIIVTLPEQLFSVAGIAAAEIQLYGAQGEILLSRTFYVQIEDSAGIGIESTDDCQTFMDALARLDDTLEAAVPAISSAAANADAASLAASAANSAAAAASGYADKVNKKAEAISQYAHQELSEELFANTTVAKINGNPKQKQLVVMKTDLAFSAVNVFAIRALIGGVYGSTVVEMTPFDVNSMRYYYAVVTLADDETGFWVVNSGASGRVINVTTDVYTVDESFEITVDMLKLLLDSSATLDGYLCGLKNLEVCMELTDKVAEIAKEAADAADRVEIAVSNTISKKAEAISQFAHQELSEELFANTTIAKINGNPRQKQLVVIKTDLAFSAVNEFTIRALIGSVYGSTVVKMTPFDVNNMRYFYAVVTLAEKETSFWVVNSGASGRVINVTTDVYTVDGRFEITVDMLKLLLESSATLDGYLCELKNLEVCMELTDKVAEIAKEAADAADRAETAISGRKTPAIYCWGDSLTHGAGATTSGGYVTMLGSLLETDGYKNEVLRRGVAGDNSNNIMNRMGAAALYIKPFTLPARNGTNVFTPIEFYDTPFGPVKYMWPADLTSGIASGIKLNGQVYGCIDGGLGWNEPLKFKRTVDGGEVTFDRPVCVTFDNQSCVDDINIIWCGTNDVGQSVDYIIERQRAMIDFLKNDKYIILGLIADIRHDVKSYNDKMSRVWGRKFLDIQSYLVQFGLSDNKLAANADDTRYIADGLIPRQLMIADQLHLNEYGYKAVANCVYAYLVNEGYISTKDRQVIR